MTGATAIKLNPDGSVNVRLDSAAVKIVESKDRCSQGDLCDRIAEQLFVSQCVQLTGPEAVA